MANEQTSIDDLRKMVDELQQTVKSQNKALDEERAARAELQKKLDNAKVKGKVKVDVDPTPGSSKTPADPLISNATPTRTEQDAKVAMALHVAADALPGQAGKTIKALIGETSYHDLEEMNRTNQATADNNALTLLDIPHDYAPIVSFGKDKLSASDDKYLTQKMALLKHTHKEIPVEAVLELIRRLHVKENCKFSEKSISDALKDTLPEAARLDLTSQLSQGIPLKDAWLSLLDSHRTRLKPGEAQVQLRHLSEDLMEDVVHQVQKIREMAAASSSSRKDQIRNAIQFTETYLENLGLDSFKIKQLKTKTGQGGAVDEWSVLFTNIREAAKDLDSIRSSRTTQRQSASIKTVGASQPDAPSETNANVNKTLQKLCSDMGQLKKDMTSTAQQVNVLTLHQAGQQQWHPPPSYSFQGGGHYRPPAPAYQPAPPPQSTTLPGPNCHPIFTGKCVLCLATDHFWQSCTVYPGKPPAPYMCWCGLGAHFNNDCRSPQLWPPEGQRDKRSLARTGIPLPASQGPPRTAQRALTGPAPSGQPAPPHGAGTYGAPAGRPAFSNSA